MRRMPTVQPLALCCVALFALAAGFWWTLDNAGAQSGLPTRPSVHTIVGLHQGLRVYWYEPNEDGGSPLTGYDVQYRVTGIQLWTNAGHAGLSQPAMIAGLRFNTLYEVRVRARNDNGAGPWSTTESRRTLTNDGRPDPPWPPTLEPGDGRIEVSWTAPAYTGSSAITGYRVRYTTDDAATWRSWAPGGERL
ncbi:MAG: fibronectin type III domain-containing protein, partial [Spirochaetaceae bacterium]|nr:fibronectin type III domain-containing protein [Spirochaetaceae bacterium]